MPSCCCGGALEGAMKFCPYCGVRQDIDLRQIHYRDLGSAEALACPSCESALSLIEFDTTPPMRVERCQACHGMFFNPGELQALLPTRSSGSTTCRSNRSPPTSATIIKSSIENARPVRSEWVISTSPDTAE